jgi:hypothetical protein
MLYYFQRGTKGNAMQTQDPVTSWVIPEMAYDAGDREWFPTTAEFYDEMLNVLPPLNWTHTAALGSCFAVSEAWKDGRDGRPVYLWFKTRGGLGCRIASCLEIAQEIKGGLRQ